MQDTRRSCGSAVPSMIKAFSFTEAEIFTQLGWSGVLEAFGLYRAKSFSPCPDGMEFFEAYSFTVFLSDLAGPGVRGVRAAP